MQEVTIASASAMGDQYRITIAKTGADTGMIRLRSWRAGHDPALAAPTSEKSINLSDIRSGDAGRSLTCEGNASGFHVALACTVTDPGGDQPPFVRIVRSKTFMRLGDGIDDYVISPADQDAVVRFIAEAGFPPLAG